MRERHVTARQSRRRTSGGKAVSLWLMLVAAKLRCVSASSAFYGELSRKFEKPGIRLDLWFWFVECF